MRHARFRSAAFATSAAVLFALALAPLSAGSENWPAFRGADALSTVDDDPRLPITWSTTENVVWKTPIPGLGWSSPVIWGDRIFLTTVVSEGEEEEPRMGLYFPYGSPQEMPSDSRFPADPRPGDLMERERSTCTTGSSRPSTSRPATSSGPRRCNAGPARSSTGTSRTASPRRPR